MGGGGGVWVWSLFQAPPTLLAGVAGTLPPYDLTRGERDIHSIRHFLFVYVAFLYTP